MIDIHAICTSVLSQVRPKAAEKKKVQVIAERIIERINTVDESDGLDITGILVGSSARDTWLSGEHDLDIFILFPPEVERAVLEEKGLSIARRIAEQSDRWEERYAEHPYIHAVFNGFDVDLVPAFRVESAADIKSAVDRTPFHSRYIASRIRGLEDEVLLLKQFMKGIGVYGSELKTHGFSGYLVELLIVHYGSFMKALEAACRWKRGTIIDMEEQGTVAHDDPLVVVDPTDPARNVAAALSLDNQCIFIDRACEFLEHPSETFFHEKVPEPLRDDEFRNIMRERGTSVIALEFTVPDVVEDVLFPQLHKVEESVLKMLERYDFRVYHSGVWAGGRAGVLFELESAKLPPVKKHTGPQVWSRTHSRAFKSKYKEVDTFSHIYIEKGNYMVDIPRKYADAQDLVASELTKCGLGKHVALSIKKEYHVWKDDELLNIRNDEFRRFLRTFFEK